MFVIIELLSNDGLDVDMADLSIRSVHLESLFREACGWEGELCDVGHIWP